MLLSTIISRLHQFTVAEWTSTGINFICIIAGVVLSYYLFALMHRNRNEARQKIVSRLAITFACLTVFTGVFSPVFDAKLNPSMKEASRAKNDVKIEKVANKQEDRPSPSNMRYLSSHRYQKVSKPKFYYYL